MLIYQQIETLVIYFSWVLTTVWITLVCCRCCWGLLRTQRNLFSAFILAPNLLIHCSIYCQFCVCCYGVLGPRSFSFSLTKDISLLLYSWNSFGTITAFLHISVKCNVNLALAVINKWYSTGKRWDDFSWNHYSHMTDQMYWGSPMTLNLPFWCISVPFGNSLSVLAIV